MFFSIIIPVYNNDVDFLKKALDSCFEQEFVDYEVVVVNDGATKSDILDFFANSEYMQNVRLINSESNQGISGARQLGIDNAQGTWICFLDCDDYLESNYLSEFYNAIQNNVDADVVMTGYKLFDNEGNVLCKYPKYEVDEFDEFIFSNTTAIWNRAYRKDMLTKNSIKFPLGCLTEDIIFTLQVNLNASKKVFINSFTYNNRYNVQSTSRSSNFTKMNNRNIPLKELDNLIAYVKSMSDENVVREVAHGLIYEYIILVGCILTRHIENEDELNKIIVQLSDLLDRLEITRSDVKKWILSKKKYGDTKMAFVETLFWYMTRFLNKSMVMKSINRIMRKVI